MKIVLNREGIQILKRLAPWTGTKYGPPELNHLLVRANGGATAAATNITTAVVAALPAVVWEEGAVLLRPGVLDTLHGEEVVDLATTEKGITLRAGSSTTTLPGDLDPAGFPAVEETSGETVFLGEFAAAPLRAALQHVRGVPTPDDAQRAWARTIWVLARGGRLLIAAADGFQLALRYVEPAEPAARDVELLASVQLGRLAGLLEETETVRLEAAANALLIATSPARLRARAALEEGRLPNYEAIVPDKDGATRAAFPAGELRRALGAVAGFSGLCDLALQDGAVSVAASGEDGTGRAEVPAAVSGAGVTVSLDARRLNLVLAGAPDEATVVAYAREPHRPVLFEFEAEGKPIAGCDVVMPMSK